MVKHNSDDKQKTEKLPKLKREKVADIGWKIGTDELWCFSNVSLHTLTHATSKLGNWLNLKMVLYLENLCLTEKIRIFNPSLLLARERCAICYTNTCQK